jgi:hypothetical protein
MKHFSRNAPVFPVDCPLLLFYASQEPLMLVNLYTAPFDDDKNVEK